MKSVEYKIAAIKQDTSQCMQTAAAQLMSYFDPSISVAEVIKEVPVYIDEHGEKIGTSPGHLAAYFVQKGYKTTAYVFDTELFDRSWQGFDASQVIKHLRRRQTFIPAHSWLAKYHHILVDGWEMYANSGGQFSFPNVSIALLRDLLTGGPYILMVNSTYLNGESKKRYEAAGDAFMDDSFAGRSLTHATTCAGYKEGKFLIIDPDPPNDVGHHRWIEADHLIASLMAAQTESDNLLMTISK